MNMMERLSRSRVAAIADAMDRLGLWDQTLPPTLQPICPPRATYAGRAKTMRMRMRPAEGRAGTPREGIQRYLGFMHNYVQAGDVVVVAFDGPAAPCEVVGSLVARWYMNLGVVGVVTNGYIRDRAEITELGFPVLAAGTSPAHIQGRVLPPIFDEPVVIGDVHVRNGDYVIGDLDGAVVVPAESQIVEQVVARLEVTDELEVKTAQALKAREPLPEVFARLGYL